MNEFQTYPSISNISHKLINTIESNPLLIDIDWVVSEKVHGCNLQFVTDGTHVTIGSRNRFLETEEDLRLFYKVDKHLSNYPAILTTMHRELDIEGMLTVYGELFGGGYDENKRKKLIQKEVLYCNEIEFYAFDIKINDQFLNHDRKNALFQRYGFIYAQDLFRGSFHDCIHYSRETRANNSTIPALLHLPPLEHNIREGNVIRPVDYVTFQNGSSVLIKDKNDKFCERQKPEKGQKEVDPKFDSCISLITPQRLNNVLSKMGDIHVLCEQKSNIPIIMRAFVNDVMEDMEDVDIDKKELIRFISRYSLSMVKDLFM